MFDRTESDNREIKSKRVGTLTRQTIIKVDANTAT